MAKKSQTTGQCIMCVYLRKVEAGAHKEYLGHMQKYHPPMSMGAPNASEAP